MKAILLALIACSLLLGAGCSQPAQPEVDSSVREKRDELRRDGIRPPIPNQGQK